MFQDITLEISLKPFKSTDLAYIRSVCAGVFEQWRPLLKNRPNLSVMLWSGDGSEILDYKGRDEDEFEWCRFVGTANHPLLQGDEPRETSLHDRKQNYMENAPIMTYGILKTIVACFKEEGARAFPSAKIRVGATFDIGPEFAISDFKYRRHPEVCHTINHFDPLLFVDSTALLHKDNYPYAAYPCGVPEGTPFATLLGKQSEFFLRDLGFDYLWLSNGLGFSADPWSKTGKLFDGERYYPEKLSEQKKKVFDFWKLFRAECSFPLEVRGTNQSVGIDYASDGVPLYDIYNADLGITAPPNSPWAALNDNYGLEIMGHMTRICELPNNRFPFRYYLHDPWWLNSPWYDRYDGSPCDIYLPMAISRIDKDGKISSANTLNILTIDNSYGNMPDACVNEPLPHLLKAEKDTPDAPAPLVWVYPMREYTTSERGDLLREMNLGDHYVEAAINGGLPLCCVTSTDSFLHHSAELYKKSAILSPVPESEAVLEKLLTFAKEGIPVMIYGTRARLATLPACEGITPLDTEKSPAAALDALSTCGYSIRFVKKDPSHKPPAFALYPRDHGLFLSAQNTFTTTDISLRLPFGAPLLIGTDAELKNGHSIYRFARGEHRECRIFVEQESGVISCREAPPNNVRYRRAIKIIGLQDATVRLFPEADCECTVGTTRTPPYDSRFKLVRDEVYGAYLEGEHITGDLYFMIGHHGTADNT